MHSARQRGFTITELVVVVGLLAIVAALAIPNLDSNDSLKLEIAAADVAGALRFAHSEALRTGDMFGVHADKSSQLLRVYRVDTSFDAATIRFDNYDPLTKQLYELNFSSDQSDVVMAEADFRFVGLAGTEFLGFAGGTGVPALGDFGKLRMLESAYILLTYRDSAAKIEISPITGRVTVQ